MAYSKACSFFYFKGPNKHNCWHLKTKKLQSVLCVRIQDWIMHLPSQMSLNTAALLLSQPDGCFELKAQELVGCKSWKVISMSFLLDSSTLYPLASDLGLQLWRTQRRLHKCTICEHCKPQWRALFLCFWQRYHKMAALLLYQLKLAVQLHLSNLLHWSVTSLSGVFAQHLQWHNTFNIT